MKNSSMRIMNELTTRYAELESIRPKIEQAIELLLKCYQTRGKILVCGNGGSAADAEHIVGELMKGFRLQRRMDVSQQNRLQKLFPKDADYLIDNIQGALPAISLVSQTALQTAFSNDKAADLVFAQQVYGYGCEGDVLIAISTSGNSKSIIHAAQIASFKKMKVISLTGITGGKLKEISDIIINVPSVETFVVQEYHLPVYHAICACLENELFES